MRCDMIFNDHFTANFVESVQVKELWILVNVWLSYDKNLVAYVFDSRCRYLEAYNIKKCESVIHLMAKCFVDACEMCCECSGMENYQQLPCTRPSSQQSNRKICECGGCCLHWKEINEMNWTVFLFLCSTDTALYLQQLTHYIAMTFAH